jgi:DNA-binding transcriptional LysR family regulator
MNLAAIDLNLLVALEALLEEVHVGRAARRVGLSQPAMSHALNRLRELFGDPLLVREGAAMQPTSRAAALRPPLTAALDGARQLLAPATFVAAQAARTFRLMMPDVVVDLLLTPLVAHLAAKAPGLRLEVVPWQSPSAAGAEISRSVDFVVAVRELTPLFRGFHRERLYEDRDALAVRHDRPGAARLSRLAGFLAARHVAVVPRGAERDLIDTWLASLGHARQLALITPSYLQALHVAAGTDLVAFAPRRLIQAQAKRLGLRIIAPPLDPGADEQQLFYPPRLAADPAAMWLKEVLIRLGTAVSEKRRIR